jgi:hypothetical protein
MSDTQARLDAIRRWQDWRGSGFPAGDEDGLVVVTELVSAIVLGDALAVELERVTAALREAEAVLLEIRSKPYRAEEAVARYIDTSGGDATGKVWGPERMRHDPERRP